MNNSREILVAGLGLLLAALSCPAANQESASFDGGGGTATAGVYQVSSSLGLIGGESSSGPVQNISGGSTTEPAAKAFAATAVAPSVDEGATLQLAGIATMDDDTVAAVPGNEIAWNPVAWPLTGIGTDGVATGAIVYADVTANFSGTYLGLPGNGTVLVRDVDPDNYLGYANDGLPDWWQHQYFPGNYADAAPTRDATGTGQNNRFKYIAGLDPTNTTSVFRLRVENVAGQPGHKKLVFSPWLSDRTYTPEFCTNLVGAAGWTNLTTGVTVENGSITDTNATGNTRFYRIQITYPSP